MQSRELNKIIRYLLICQRVFTKIKKETHEWGFKGKEACGALVGYRLCKENNCYLIVKDTLIGPNTRRHNINCFIDAEYVEKELTKLKSTEPYIDYLGEWHSHYFQEIPSPSGADIGSLQEINLFENGRYHPAVLVITGLKKRTHARISMKAFSYTPSHNKVYRVPIQVIGEAYRFDTIDLDIFSRINEVVRISDLSKKNVAIIGLGSGGSNVALLLAKSGVGNFILIDYDIYAPANVIRGAPLMLDVGYPKTLAVKRVLRRYGVRARIEAYEAKLDLENYDKMKELLKKVDLIVDATGSVQAHLLLNKVALELKKPLIMSWAAPYATINIVFIMLAEILGFENYACYECLFKHKIFEETPYDEGDLEERYRRYGYDYRQLDQAIAAQGLLIDLMPAVSYTAKLALRILQGKTWFYMPN
ncbi:MAG TPA: hypothetical protein ENG44_01045, partial [Desulfurococcaceae archaeon]|nr:hypothetical protein [Desulfurococcaceae archaeon]